MSTEVALAVSSDGERIEDRRSGRVAQVVNPMLTSLRYLQWDSKSPMIMISLSGSASYGMIKLTSAKVESKVCFTGCGR